MDPVGDGAVVVEGCEYLFIRLKNILQPTDIQECFLLPGEGRIGQVLGASPTSGRRPVARR